MIFKLFNPLKMKKLLTGVLIVLLSILIYSCGPLKYKPVDARKVSPNVNERVAKNIEEGRGFRIMGGKKKGGTFDFASSNYLWRATLDTIDFMPLVSANYSGGIVITDWYSENNNQGESIKISVRFLSNDIRADAIDVKVFLKQCDQNLNCVVSENKGKLTNELMASILKKAARYEKDGIEKNKKKNPYRNVELGTED
tara:strand:- start:161 stop:754 length:594 start_codon:yes stop_codon:yes gene_type:complete